MALKIRVRLNRLSGDRLEIRILSRLWRRSGRRLTERLGSRIWGSIGTSLDRLYFKVWHRVDRRRKRNT
jgi:hypothetical protein